MHIALFFITLFFIAVSGIVLLKPQQAKNLREYSTPAVQKENRMTVGKMATFLQENPKITEQKELKELPVSMPKPVSTAQVPVERNVEVQFQGGLMRFKNSDELNEWLYRNVTQDAIGFLRQFQEDGHPEFYLQTLKKISEIDRHEEVRTELKKAYLIEAKKLLQGSNDGFHQELAKKAVKAYVDLEKDKELAKQTADEILKASSTQPGSP